MDSVHNRDDQALQPALKEWAVTVAALGRGATSVLLRKGGIRETQGQFGVERDRVWLFPTTEHQRAEWLKPEFVDDLTETDPSASTHGLAIAHWAEITHLGQVRTPEDAAALFPFHIWSNALVTKRLTWKPQAPLFVLGVRVYRLTEPLGLPNPADYGGCKSWLSVPLPAMDTVEATPVLGAIAHAERMAQIGAKIPFHPFRQTVG